MTRQGDPLVSGAGRSGSATYLRAWSELHGGVDPSASALVGLFVRGGHRLALPLARAGVPASAVTVLGVLLGTAAAGLAEPVGGSARLGVVLAAAFVALSGISDLVDGALAIERGTAGVAGWVLDSVADRSADAAYVVALWRLGAPAWLAVAAGGAGWLLEYVRARAAAGGLPGVLVVTVGERPARIAVVVGALVTMAAFGGAALVRERIAVTGAAVLLAVAVVGLGQLAAAIGRAGAAAVRPGR